MSLCLARVHEWPVWAGEVVFSPQCLGRAGGGDAGQACTSLHGAVLGTTTSLPRLSSPGTNPACTAFRLFPTFVACWGLSACAAVPLHLRQHQPLVPSTVDMKTVLEVPSEERTKDAW